MSHPWDRHSYAALTAVLSGVVRYPFSLTSTKARRRLDSMNPSLARVAGRGATDRQRRNRGEVHRVVLGPGSGCFATRRRRDKDLVHVRAVLREPVYELLRQELPRYHRGALRHGGERVAHLVGGAAIGQSAREVRNTSEDCGANRGTDVRPEKKASWTSAAFACAAAVVFAVSVTLNSTSRTALPLCKRRALELERTSKHVRTGFPGAVPSQQIGSQPAS